VYSYTPNVGYSPQSNVGVGPGYWVRYPSATNQPISGYAVPAATFDVSAGWNLIGSITDPVAVSEVTSIPGGMISSNFFGYHGMYENADTIRPGGAYWVKMADSGSLVLDPSGVAAPANRIRIVTTDERPPGPPAAGPAGAGGTIPPPTDYRGPEPFIVLTGSAPRSGAGDGASTAERGSRELAFRYWLPGDGPVTVRLLDRSRTEVATLVRGFGTKGFNEVRWAAADLPPGSYVCELNASGRISARMVTIPGKVNRRKGDR
jgi:hypothetical protein